MTRTYTFLNAVTSDGSGPSLSVDTTLYPAMTIQVAVGTAASVTIEGRFEGTDKWAVMSDGAVTATEAFRVWTMPIMRATATGVNGALTVYGGVSPMVTF